MLHAARKPEPEIAERVDVPEYADLLPEPIRKFTRRVADEDYLSFVQGGGHGGWHPHLVNEFLSWEEAVSSASLGIPSMKANRV